MENFKLGQEYEKIKNLQKNQNNIPSKNNSPEKNKNENIETDSPISPQKEKEEILDNNQDSETNEKYNQIGIQFIQYDIEYVYDLD